MAYGARLESVLGESPRGFESPILRHKRPERAPGESTQPTQRGPNPPFSATSAQNAHWVKAQNPFIGPESPTLRHKRPERAPGESTQPTQRGPNPPPSAKNQLQRVG